MLTESERKLIGGSDSSAIVGVNPFASAIDVWTRIVEGKELRADAGVFQKKRGTLMEPVIRSLAVDEYGLKLKGPRSIRSPEHPWLRASLDDVHQADSDEEVVEFKSVNLRVANRYGDGPDDIPDYVNCQVQFYLAAAKMRVAHVVAFIGGDELRHYQLIADPELQGLLFDACERFWKDHVLPKRPPPPDGSDSYSEWIDQHFTNRRAELAQADQKTTAIALEYRAMCEEAKKYEEKAKALRQQLELVIGEASGLEGPFGRISFKRNKDTVKVDFEGIVANMNVPDEVKNMHTSIRPGPRVFRATWSSK